MTGPLDQSMGDFLQALASEEPAPGGGAAAAITVGLAAALVAMSARFSRDELDAATELVARAEAVRARAAPLAEADGEAYRGVLAAFRMPRDDNPHDREAAIEQALSTAANVPLAVGEAAAELAVMAADLAEGGNRNLRGDAVTAALLAEAAARSAATLVAINLRAPDDARISDARHLAETAAAAAGRALKASS